MARKSKLRDEPFHVRKGAVIERVCLYCNRPFKAIGKFNRICDRCVPIIAKLDDNDTRYCSHSSHKDKRNRC